MAKLKGYSRRYIKWSPAAAASSSDMKEKLPKTKGGPQPKWPGYFSKAGETWPRWPNGKYATGGGKCLYTTF